MRPRKKTDDEILEIARQVFISNGPQSAVEEISKIIGLSQPALFKRFGTKRNLLLQTFKLPSYLPWYGMIEKGPDDRPFVEQLIDLALEIRTWFAKLVPMIMAAKFSGIPPNELMKELKEPIPVKAVRLLSEWLQRCCTKGMIRNTDFRVAATSILGFIHSDTTMSTMMQQEKNKGDARKDIAKCADFIWHGLKPEE